MISDDKKTDPNQNSTENNFAPPQNEEKKGRSRKRKAKKKDTSNTIVVSIILQKESQGDCEDQEPLVQRHCLEGGCCVGKGGLHNLLFLVWCMRDHCFHIIFHFIIC